jgi:hypothetical protein
LLVLSCSAHPVGLCRNCNRPLWLSDLFADIQSYRRMYFCPQCGRDVTTALHEHVDTCAVVAQGVSRRPDAVSDVPANTSDDASLEIAHASRVILQCLAARDIHDKAKTTRMAVAFAASALVTVMLALPVVSSIAHLVRGPEGEAPAAIADGMAPSNGQPPLEPGAPSVGSPESVRSLMTGPPAAYGPPALPERPVATRVASVTGDAGRDDRQAAEVRPRRAELAPAPVPPQPTQPTIATVGPNSDQAATLNRDASPTATQPECSLKSRIMGDLRKAFTLCPDERRHVARVERFLDDVGDIAERGTTEVVSSIKRVTSLTPTDRARLEQVKRFVRGLPDAPAPKDDHFQGK